MERIIISSELPSDLETSNRLYIQTAQHYNEAVSEIEKLRSELDWLKRHVFGRRTEKYYGNPNQQVIPGLIDTDTEEDVCAPDEHEEEAETAAGTKEHKKKKRNGRNPLPAHLPRKQVVHEPPKNKLFCGKHGKPLKQIGFEKTEELEFIPASFYVIEHIRPKYACADDCTDPCGSGVVIADLPKRPIDKGRPGPGLLGQVSIAKYVDHQPLNHQEQIYKRSGVYIPKNTMVDWIRCVYDLLYPIYLCMKLQILESFCVQSDDTPITVLVGKKNHSHKGYIWNYLGVSCQQVVYKYTEQHNKDGPLQFFSGYKGYVQADAYTGYDACFKTGEIIEVGCWAHCRRGIYEALSTDKDLAEHMLEKIRKLYEIERVCKEAVLNAQEIYRKRQKESKPILADIKKWLDTNQKLVLPQSPIGKAITYAQNQWKALNRYLEDGRLSIDNNQSERALRTIVKGRLNYMFCGSHEGAKRAALIYSLVGSCKLLGIEPFEYMRDVIERMPTHPKDKVSELTPIEWKKARDKYCPSPKEIS
ncbi:MAG: IS66 family transposase [bacterium]